MRIFAEERRFDYVCMWLFSKTIGLAYCDISIMRMRVWLRECVYAVYCLETNHSLIHLSNYPFLAPPSLPSLTSRRNKANQRVYKRDNGCVKWEFAVDIFRSYDIPLHLNGFGWCIAIHLTYKLCVDALKSKWIGIRLFSSY